MWIVIRAAWLTSRQRYGPDASAAQLSACGSPPSPQDDGRQEQKQPPHGALRSNTTFNIDHRATRTAATLGFVVYNPDVFMSGDLIQGTAAIAATSTSIVCKAMTVDRLSPHPTGIALHGIRSNPAPGSQE